MAIDVSGVNFFMPVFSFLFVFVIVYAILAKTKILGDNKFVNLVIGFIMAIIFMSFSSTELYVETIIPWAAVLLVMIFLVLLIAGLSTKDLDKIMTTKFAWVVIAILIIIFIIAAIKVFNPVFHPDYIVVSGDKPLIISQIWNFLGSKNMGIIFLIVIALLVSWIITKK
jgi:hypothetical protein